MHPVEMDCQLVSCEFLLQEYELPFMQKMAVHREYILETP